MLHIDIPSQTEIERLNAARSTPSVSIYMRTTPLTQEAQKDRINLKNLLREAISQMEAGDIPKRAIWPIDEAVTALIEDDDFWVHQANSLAILATPEKIRTWRLPNRIEDQVAVSDRFHLKPMLRAVTFPHNAYVLAISVGHCRLVEVSADLPPHDVAVPGLPKNFNDALGKRSHTENRDGMASGEGTSESAMFNRYARAVDHALRPVLSGHERPLIVAASEPLGSIYRSVSTYANTADEVIAGSADHRPDHELAAEARTILDGIYAGQIADLKSLFGERENQGRATGDVASAARAATFGAVDTLIVDMDAHVPGTIADDGVVSFAETADASSYGVVDEITARAIASGARIVAARREDIPGGGDLAAILRYAI